MSHRETQLDGTLQQWRGVDQRTQPTLVRDGFFVMSRGVFFGLGDNAERVPGKKLAGLQVSPIFHIHQFGDKALVQGMDQVWMVDVAELVELNIVFQPGVPDPPTFDNITGDSLDVILPATLPVHTVSFTLQSSPDDLVWTTVATGLAPLQVVGQSGLTALTTYYYRVIAVGVGADTTGPSADVTTTAAAPTNDRLTEASDTRITEAGDTRIVD